MGQGGREGGETAQRRGPLTSGQEGAPATPLAAAAARAATSKTARRDIAAKGAAAAPALRECGAEGGRGV